MIGFVGLSHLGIISSISGASKGFEVIGYDPNALLCGELSEGKLPIYEPHLDELLAKHNANIRFTADISQLHQCRLIVFSIDIKTDESNHSDLSVLESLIDTVLKVISQDTILVVLSQVPPGFSRRLFYRLKDELQKKNARLYYQVETLIFGQAVERALHPERYIVGCNDPSESLPDTYLHFLESFQCPILAMRYESAELAKISINCCLVASVSTANTLAEICENVGADWAEIIPALRLDKRIGGFAYLEPGLGIAGGNLERDLVTIIRLSNEFGTDSGVVDSWISNSAYRKDWVFRKLHETVLSKYQDPQLAVWGLTYKVDTKSIKNSPSLVLLKNLMGISVKAYDPQATLESSAFPHVTQVLSPLEACRGAKALVIMTPWTEFKSIDPVEIKNNLDGDLIIDPYKTLNAQRCKNAGLKYLTLGRPMEFTNGITS